MGQLFKNFCNGFGLGSLFRWKKNATGFNFFLHLWDNFFNSFAAPSAESIYLDKNKSEHTSTFFSICRINFSKICTAPSAERLYLDIKKRVSRLQLFFSFVGRNFKYFCSASHVACVEKGESGQKITR